MNASRHPSADDTTEQCADCVLQRDCQSCFAEIVDRLGVPLLHFLIRQNWYRHDAEDLLQETFLAAYRHRARFRSSSKYSTWIFTIAYRLSISRRRKRRFLFFSFDNTVEPSAPRDSANSVERTESRDNLWESVRTVLSPDSYTAIWLSYVESMSADEVGAVIGRSGNAVRILLHRARLQLAEHLDVKEELNHERRK